MGKAAERMKCAKSDNRSNYNSIIIRSELADVENFVLKYGFEALSARDKHGYTPAHWLALDGNDELMRYLIQRNAPIDLRCLGTQGPRPIHWACRKGHTSKLKIACHIERKCIQRSFVCC